MTEIEQTISASTGGGIRKKMFKNLQRDRQDVKSTTGGQVNSIASRKVNGNEGVRERRKLVSDKAKYGWQSCFGPGKTNLLLAWIGLVPVGNDIDIAIAEP